VTPLHLYVGATWDDEPGWIHLVRRRSWSSARGRQGRGAFAAAQPGRARPSSLRPTTNTALEERFPWRKSGGSERIVKLRAEMHQIMEESAGIYRTETVQGGGGS